MPYQKCQRPPMVVRCTVDKSKVEISQNFVAISEYMNFISPLETWQPIFLATKKSLMFFRMRFPQCIRYWILVKVFFQKVSDKNFRSYLNKHLSYSSCTISAQSELQLHCQNWDDNLINCNTFFHLSTVTAIFTVHL